MSTNKDESTINPEDLKRQWNEFEQEAIGIWLLLKMSEGQPDLEFSWREITAIPQTEFSLLKSLPDLPTLLLKSLRTTLFSELHLNSVIKYRENSSNLSNGAALNKKQEKNVSAHLKKEVEETSCLSFSFIIQELRKAAFVRVDELREECNMRLAAIEKQLDKDEESDSEELEFLGEQYRRLLEFSLDNEEQSIPFSFDAILTRLSEHFISIRQLLKKYNQNEVPLEGFIFWHQLLGSVLHDASFSPIWPRLSVKTFYAWFEVESYFFLRRLEAANQVDPDAFETTSQALTSVDFLESLRAEIADIAFRVNAILADESRLNEAISVLLEKLFLANEVYARANIFKEKESQPSEGAPESSPKKRKHATLMSSEKKVEYARFLNSMAYATYTFIAKIDRAAVPIPALTDDGYISAHAYAFGKLREKTKVINHLHQVILGFRPFIEDVCPDEQQLCAHFISILREQDRQCSQNLSQLSQSRNLYKTRLVKKYPNLEAFYQNSLVDIEAQISSLLSPGWTEFEEGRCNFDIISALLERLEHVLKDFSGLRDLVQFTNQSSETYHAYPEIEENELQQWDDALGRMMQMRSELIETFLRAIRRWLGKVKAICDIQETSFEDLDKHYYILALYQRNRTYFLNVLEMLSEDYGSEEMSDLVFELLLLHPDIAQNYMTKMRSSAAVNNFINRLSGQKSKLKATVKSMPKMFNCLVDFFEAANQKNLHNQLLLCLSALRPIKQLNAENEAIESEFLRLNDFFESCSWFSNLKKVRQSLSDSLAVLSRNYTHFEKLIGVYQKEIDDFENNNMRTRFTLLETLKNISEAYKLVNWNFQEALDEIEACEEKDNNVLSRCSASLRTASEQGKLLQKTLNDALQRSGAFCRALDSEPASLKELTMDVLKDLQGHLQTLMGKIQRVEKTLEPKLDSAGSLII